MLTKVFPINPNQYLGMLNTKDYLIYEKMTKFSLMVKTMSVRKTQNMKMTQEH